MTINLIQRLSEEVLMGDQRQGKNIKNEYP